MQNLDDERIPQNLDDERIPRLIALIERMMATLENHQARITKLEYMLSLREKKVSKNPGDREV